MDVLLFKNNLKMALMEKISYELKSKNITQSEMAIILKTRQSKISQLLQYKNIFTIDKLFEYIFLLGVDLYENR